MKQETIDQLTLQLKELGFEQPRQLLDKSLNGSFTLFQHGFPASIAAQVEKLPSAEYKINICQVTIQDIYIPDQYKLLDEKLLVVNNLNSTYYPGEQKPADELFIQSVNAELEQLLHTNREMAELFILKYLPEEEQQFYIRDLDTLRQQHETTYYVTPVISAAAILSLHKNLSEEQQWLVYNSKAGVLQPDEIYFASSKEEAISFAYGMASSQQQFDFAYVKNPGEAIQTILTKNPLLMNENNLKYLQDNLKYHGFGELLYPELANHLQKGSAEFSMVYKTEINKREMEATLHFKKSDTSELYFFNKYDTRLKNEKDETMSQTFYINKGSGMTLKEGYNLLNGRAVFKELTNKDNEKYHAWVQLDFAAKDKNGNYERKQYHQNYGYDLKEALSYYLVKELLKEDSAKDFLRSLERGNVQMATLEVGGKEVKVFLEANPQFKSLNLYNGKMERLDKEARQGMMQEPVMKEKVNGTTKEVAKTVSKEEKKSLLPKKEKGNGLLEKKRTNKGKGLELK